MRNLLYSFLALAVFCLAAFAGGVGNGTTWSNSANTHSVTIGLEAQTSGNYKVTFTEGDNSGSTDWGTPDPDGGVSDCPSVAVGEDGEYEHYRVQNGKVQWLNPNDEWIDLGKDPENAYDIWVADDEGVGTLPIPYE